MDTNETYRQKAEAQVEEMDARLRELRAKAERKKADLKVDYFERIGQLEQKRDRLRSQLEKMKDTGSEAWDEMKQGFEFAMEDLRDGVKKAVDTMKESS